MDAEQMQAPEAESGADSGANRSLTTSWNQWLIITYRFLS